MIIKVWLVGTAMGPCLRVLCRLKCFILGQPERRNCAFPLRPWDPTAGLANWAPAKVTIQSHLQVSHHALAPGLPPDSSIDMRKSWERNGQKTFSVCSHLNVCESIHTSLDFILKTILLSNYRIIIPMIQMKKLQPRESYRSCWMM